MPSENLADFFLLPWHHVRRSFHDRQGRWIRKTVSIGRRKRSRLLNLSDEKGLLYETVDNNRAGNQSIVHVRNYWGYTFLIVFRVYRT